MLNDATTAGMRVSDRHTATIRHSLLHLYLLSYSCGACMINVLKPVHNPPIKRTMTMYSDPSSPLILPTHKPFRYGGAKGSSGFAFALLIESLTEK